MSETAPETQTPPTRSGIWRGVAGCFLTAAFAALGAGLGLLVGWNMMPPKWDPMRGGSEFHGLGVLFEQAATLVIGAAVGAMVGTLLGVVLSVILFRRRKGTPGS